MKNRLLSPLSERLLSKIIRGKPPWCPASSSFAPLPWWSRSNRTPQQRPRADVFSATLAQVSPLGSRRAAKNKHTSKGRTAELAISPLADVDAERRFTGPGSPHFIHGIMMDHAASRTGRWSMKYGGAAPVWFMSRFDECEGSTGPAVHTFTQGAPNTEWHQCVCVYVCVCAHLIPSQKCGHTFQIDLMNSMLLDKHKMIVATHENSLPLGHVPYFWLFKKHIWPFWLQLPVNAALHI